MEIKEQKVYTITLNVEEFDLLRKGIGNTSPTSRENAGMERDQAEFFSDLYDTLRELI